MNKPHFQSSFMVSTVFTEFAVTLLVNVILSEAKLQRSGRSPRGQAFNLKIVF